MGKLLRSFLSLCKLVTAKSLKLVIPTLWGTRCSRWTKTSAFLSLNWPPSRPESTKRGRTWHRSPVQIKVSDASHHFLLKTNLFDPIYLSFRSDEVSLNYLALVGSVIGHQVGCGIEFGLTASWVVHLNKSHNAFSVLRFDRGSLTLSIDKCISFLSFVFNIF